MGIFILLSASKITQIILIKVESSREYWKFSQKESSWQNYRVRGGLSGISLNLSLQFSISDSRLNVMLNLQYSAFVFTLSLSSFSLIIEGFRVDSMTFTYTPCLLSLLSLPLQNIQTKSIWRSTVPENTDMPRQLKTRWEVTTHFYKSIKSLQTDLCYIHLHFWPQFHFQHVFYLLPSNAKIASESTG